MKKNVCVFLLIVALVLSLSACSHNQIPVTDLDQKEAHGYGTSCDPYAVAEKIIECIEQTE